MADELSSLPAEILSQILSLVLTMSPLKEGVRLRTLSHLFDRQVMAVYVDLHVLDAHLKAASLDEQSMSPQWLYRYVKAQISIGEPENVSMSEPENVTLSNLRGAARLLESIPDFQPSKQFEGRRLQRETPPINIEFADRPSRINALVALTLVNCLEEPGYDRIDWFIREEDQPTALGWALMTAILVADSTSIVTLLEQNHTKDDLGDAMILATEERHLNIVRLLLNSGADANAAPSLYFFDPSALRGASADGNVEIVDLLLTPEYSPKRHGPDYERAIDETISRLGKALSSGSGNADQYANITQMLLRHAQPKDCDRFHYHVASTAIRLGAKDALLVVLDRGFNVSHIPRDGSGTSLNPAKSLLVTAAQHGCAEMVQLLLDHGARSTSKNAATRDAVRHACVHGQPDALRVLLTIAFPSVNDYGQARAAAHLLRTATDHLGNYHIRESAYLRVLQVFCDRGFNISTANFRGKILKLTKNLGYYHIGQYVLSLPVSPPAGRVGKKKDKKIKSKR